jgi:tripartite-type tricarboxylate transporter receptor subunit TctC
MHVQHTLAEQQSIGRMTRDGIRMPGVNNTREKTMTRLMLVLVLGFAQPVAQAQTWPVKPLRAVVPVGAGSSTDIVHRLVLEQLSAGLGQPIVVENRTGAGGTIGTAVVAKAQPDGYTLLAHGSAHTIAPALYKALPFDAVRDFIPVVPIGTSPSVLVVAPAKATGTAQALVAASKARPGALNFSSVGIGTATHLSAERFVSSAGIHAVHVPFKGGAEAMLEVIAGRADFFFGPVALVLPQIRDGKLLALAVNGSRRAATLPNVPTLQEAGYSDAEYPIWFGLFAPARTPASTIDKLNHETLKVLQSAAVREKLSVLGVEPMVMTPQEFKLHVEKDVALNAILAKKAGLKAE